MDIKYGCGENLAKNLVFIDGLTRAGKSLFSSIIPSMQRVEHIQFYWMLEYFIPAISLGTLDVSFAKSLLRTNMNELAYNLRLARNVNFRYDDQTGIFNYHDPKLYFKRLAKEEGDAIVQELRNTDRYIPFMTHELLTNLEYLDMLDIDYKMIELYRHPVDNVYSWWTRGWGERFITDPRQMTLSLSCRDKVVPWYCAGYEEEWLDMNPMERCVRIVLDMIRRSVKQYNKAAFPEKILIITFEDFVQDPYKELEVISQFLNTSISQHTSFFVSKERCPRTLNPADQKRKLDEFRSGVRKELLDDLLKMSEEYEKDLYGLRY